MKITWSPKAVEDFDKILAYIKQKWGRKETEAFLNKTIRVLNIIEQHPRIFIESSKKRTFEKLLSQNKSVCFIWLKLENGKLFFLRFGTIDKILQDPLFNNA